MSQGLLEHVQGSCSPRPVIPPKHWLADLATVQSSVRPCRPVENLQHGEAECSELL